MDPNERGKGYATKLASDLCDRFEKASFLVKKENEASIKVALAALRDKFSMTTGRHVVRLTKEAVDPGLLAGLALAGVTGGMIGRAIGRRLAARPKSLKDRIAKLFKKSSASEGAGDERNTVGTTLEGKIHESFTVAADKMIQAGLLTTRERIALSGAIGDMLGKFRKSVDKNVASRPMSQNAHDLLKKALAKRADDAVGKGDDEEPSTRHERKLRRMVEPVARQLPPLYKTKRAKGWDVLTESLITDDQSTPGR